LIRKLSVAGATRILIGDGQSDCAAAECVNQVFAKGWLQRYCRQRNLPCQPIRHLRDVVDYLGLVGESDGEVASL
jgi:2-hydroxy-3-keto-5-methylthiopentenyl-1-phosphate phosphatase